MLILDKLQCGVSIHNERWPIPTVARVALAWFGRFTLTHHSTTSLHKRNEMVAGTRELPASGSRLKWTADSKPNLLAKTGPGQVEKN
ncbi:hypothetical protein V1278_002524 [Bradyrhizobium sp. AZCC 1577]